MAVCAPAGVAQIHLDVAGLQAARRKLHHGTENPAAFAAVETRMKHANGLTVKGAQLLAAQALLPDVWRQFCSPAARLALVQRGPGLWRATPLGIGVGRSGLHLELLLRRSRKSQVRVAPAGDGNKQIARCLVQMKMRLSSKALGKTGGRRVGAFYWRWGFLRAPAGCRRARYGTSARCRPGGHRAGHAERGEHPTSRKSWWQRNTPEDWMQAAISGWPAMRRREEEINRSARGDIEVIIDDEGYILTNLHVVRRAQRVQVQLWDGREYEAEPILDQPKGFLC